MFSLIGIAVVIGAILAGYLMEKGNVLVLLQPAELVIIGGAAVGTLLIANPIHILKQIVAGLMIDSEGIALYQESLQRSAEYVERIVSTGETRRAGEARRADRRAGKESRLPEISDL